LRPRQNLVSQVVENIVAAIRCNSKDGVPLPIALVDNRHEQRLARPAGFQKDATLKQRVAVASAGTVVRIAPPLDHAIVIHVGLRVNVVIDPQVDAPQITPGIIINDYIKRRERLCIANRRIRVAKLQPAAWRC